ncbi:DeoR/GlpR family DNA-binding transcription regulator [Anaerolinea thermophila]|uniref:DeoR family transcriptional regulator n=1 Tax=Anaerolinea thermophila (strain DSM 14523 / JCM 11388 / NBRC 100420 / UNI-1) TaxID=926569 RepID=E8N0P6_ANATU|nr:DeoR/GlpR family DNA-binding transcription regulator [Anaerolinea thermophila]BAJ62441.1 DeoR family transcriptional regulator [Anaerolinea thermophila UNI-1]
MDIPSLSNIERQQAILALLQRQQRVKIAQICEEFAVSEATARRDLEALASQGLIQRVHGGAIPLQPAAPEPPLLERSHEQADEKARIGRLAATLVQDGETVFLGSGTTVLEIAKHLRERKGLTIITNSLPVVNLFAGMEHIQVVCLGGILRDSELSFIGHITEQALSEVRADKVFLGVRAVDLEHGLTNDYLPETMTDRAILKIGREVIVVADHTKCCRVSTAFLAPLTSMHTFITTQEADESFISALQELGVRVLLA